MFAKRILLAPRMIGAAFLVTLGGASAWATAPDHQSILSGTNAWNNLYGVVRIRDENGFQGTGSVFGKKRLGDDYWLCVLTADHVVRGSRFIDVGFENEIVGGARGPEFRASQIYLGGNANIQDPDDPQKVHNPDIAVVGVKVDLAVFNKANEYALADRHSLDRGRFSDVGYGNTGIRFVDQNGNWLGYDRVGNSYGTKRFANGQTGSASVNGDYGGRYHGVYFDWTFEKPTNADDFTRGYGVAFDGDSGSPYFASRDTAIDLATGQDPDPNGINVVVKTEFQMAVHHGRPPGNPLTPKLFGHQGRATELVPIYRDWAYEKCAMVPEPGTLAALGLGALALARRRRNRR